MDSEFKEVQNGNELQIDGEAEKYLQEIARWSGTVAKMVFAASGLLLLATVLGRETIIRLVEKAIPVNTIGSNLGGVMIAMISFILLIVCFVYFFLFQFSKKIKTGLSAGQADEFDAGIRSFKTYWNIAAIASGVSLINSLMTLILRN